jgi:transposase
LLTTAVGDDEAEGGSSMEISTIGIDIGKNHFHVVGFEARGGVVLRRQCSRQQVIRELANRPPCLIGMEACGGAHHLGRVLLAQGHDVRLIPPQYVKPFVKSQKNDLLDAEAIGEAVQRPTMRFVPLKTEDQLDLQAVHRVRARLVARRTAVINQLRGFLLERGVTFPVGRRALIARFPEVLDNPAIGLSPRFCRLLQQLRDEWRLLDRAIDDADQEIQTLARTDAACVRLTQVPGIGPLTATALVAAVGDGAAFTKGRDLAAWLGLVPRQHSTGGKTTLRGISKRGNTYLRFLFIHGARAVCRHHRQRPHRLGRWLGALEARAHPNIVVVALANKLARTAWAVLQKDARYDGRFLAGACGRPSRAAESQTL